MKAGADEGDTARAVDTERAKRASQANVRTAFRVFDRDDDGLLSRADLGDLVRSVPRFRHREGQELTEEQLDAMFREVPLLPEFC